MKKDRKAKRIKRRLEKKIYIIENIAYYDYICNLNKQINIL